MSRDRFRCRDLRWGEGGGRYVYAILVKQLKPYLRQVPLFLYSTVNMLRTKRIIIVPCSYVQHASHRTPLLTNPSNTNARTHTPIQSDAKNCH